MWSLSMFCVIWPFIIWEIKVMKSPLCTESGAHQGTVLPWSVLHILLLVLSTLIDYLPMHLIWLSIKLSKSRKIIQKCQCLLESSIWKIQNINLISGYRKFIIELVVTNSSFKLRKLLQGQSNILHKKGQSNIVYKKKNCNLHFLDLHWLGEIHGKY